jgi:hypothetical protein
MHLTCLTAPSFKKKQIVTTEDQHFVSFCPKSPFLAGALLFLALATTVQAQFTYTTNNGTITITGYTGINPNVAIPGTIDGLMVTDIGTNAFQNSGLTSVTIPDSVTNIGSGAFETSESLTNVTFGDSVISIGDYAFYGCQALTNVTMAEGLASIGSFAFSGWVVVLVLGDGPGPCALTSITIPSSVTNIGIGAFEGCANLTAISVASNNPAYSSLNGVLFNKTLTTLVAFPAGLAGNYTIPSGVRSIASYAFGGRSLTSITMPASVTNVGDYAFYGCLSLTSAYFLGNAPSTDTTFKGVFYIETVTAYYLPGTTGWAEFAPNTGALWTLSYPLVLDGSSGVQANQFGFTISWATNVPVVVEASTDLSKPVWTPIATNTLTGGASYFSDPQWTNYPARFYRVKSQEE